MKLTSFGAPRFFIRPKEETKEEEGRLQIMKTQDLLESTM